MKQATRRIKIATSGKGLYDVTPPVLSWITSLQVNAGLLTLFVQHTTASLTIQENADPDVLQDLNDYFTKLVPEDSRLYRHAAEGPDDMPSHIRASLTHAHLSIPIIDGSLALGTWQAIYLFEHRAQPHQRSIALHVMGE